MSEFPPFPRHRLLERWLILSFWICVAASLIYAVFLRPIIDAAAYTHHPIFLPTGLLTPIGMAPPSLALGLLAAIWSLSPLPARGLLKPSRARLVGTLLLWVIFPLASLSLVPVSAGWVAAVAVDNLTAGRWDTMPFLICFTAFVASYLIACLLSSGLPQRWRRLLA